LQNNLAIVKGELGQLKNQLKDEKDKGNSAKVSELKTMIRMKKKDYDNLKEEKKVAKKAQLDLKKQLKDAKTGKTVDTGISRRKKNRRNKARKESKRSKSRKALKKLSEEEHHEHS
jgi:hypothetical protein